MASLATVQWRHGEKFPTLIVNKSVINEGRIMQRLPYMTSSSAIKC